MIDLLPLIKLAARGWENGMAEQGSGKGQPSSDLGENTMNHSWEPPEPPLRGLNLSVGSKPGGAGRDPQQDELSSPVFRCVSLRGGSFCLHGTCLRALRLQAVWI